MLTRRTSVIHGERASRRALRNRFSYTTWPPFDTARLLREGAKRSVNYTSDVQRAVGWRNQSGTPAACADGGRPRWNVSSTFFSLFLFLSFFDARAYIGTNTIGPLTVDDATSTTTISPSIRGHQRCRSTGIRFPVALFDHGNYESRAQPSAFGKRSKRTGKKE